MTGTGDQSGLVAQRVARDSYGKLVAWLARDTGDLAGAEDALSEAFARALADWPQGGLPERPEAWLLSVARNQARDAGRKRRGLERAVDAQMLLAEEVAMTPQDGVPDRRLELMFACTDPAIDEALRAPLILQVVMGVTAAEIASAFLVAPATMGQRLSRAKARIRSAGTAFRVPERGEMSQRLDWVLQAIYAAYAAGWKDTGRREDGLEGEAIWLGRVVCRLLPDAPEALGLLALMLFVQSRRQAGRDARGCYVPLADQVVTGWDGAMIDEADRLLVRASAMGRGGRYQLEAAIQAVHAGRRFSGQTDWALIRRLYDGLLALTGSVVVAVNRAMAVAATEGDAAGLASLPAPDVHAELLGFQPYWAVRAELLLRLGRGAEAAEACDVAAGLTADPVLRRYFLEKRLRLPV